MSQEKQEYLERLRKEMELFTAATERLCRVFNDDFAAKVDINEYIVDKYPFDQSFTDIPVREWSDEVIKKINQQIS